MCSDAHRAAPSLRIIYLGHGIAKRRWRVTTCEKYIDPLGAGSDEMGSLPVPSRNLHEISSSLHELSGPAASIEEEAWLGSRTSG
jgi:hypothetical protein